MLVGQAELQLYIFCRGIGEIMTVARFWRKIKARYNLEGTHCGTCDGFFYPPRNVCPVCRRDGKMETYEFKGTGEVMTFTIIRTASEGFEHLTPFVVAIIKFDEGTQITGQIVGNPANVAIGMRVKSIFRKLGQESEKGMIYYGTKFVPEKK